MTLRRLSPWLVGMGAVFCLFSTPRAYGATVAVMPVEGVNLSPGECDAIGVLFANAFSRDANVAVLSPIETKAIRQQSPNAMTAAAQMGVALYAELTAMQLGTTVKLAGTLFNKDGSVVYRAQTVAPSLDAMEMETARLARALILRQPVMPTAATGVAAPEAPPTVESPASDREVDDEPYPKALGVKLSMLAPHSSGRSFSPLVGAGFDGRIGTRAYFFEFAASFAAPLDDSSSSNDLRVTILSAELGGSYYLNDGSAGVYLGGGVSPSVWMSRRGYASDSTSASLAVYGQLGVTFTRDSRLRVYGEVRLAQYCLGVTDPLVNSYGSDAGTSDTYYPLTVAFQMGLGW